MCATSSVGCVDHAEVAKPLSILLGDCPCLVGRSVIGDDHFPWLGPALTGERLELRRDGVGCIKAWNDDAEPHEPFSLLRYVTRYHSPGKRIGGSITYFSYNKCTFFKWNIFAYKTRKLS
jgi:hypothetical protein